MTDSRRPMGRTAKIEIEMGGDVKRAFHLYEIRPYDVLQLLNDVTGETEIADLAEALLPLCSSVTVDDLWGPDCLFPSQKKLLWDKFKEVNEDFFEMARRMDLWQNLRRLAVQTVGPQMVGAAQSELLRLFGGSKELATGKPDTSGGLPSCGVSKISTDTSDQKASSE